MKVAMVTGSYPPMTCGVGDYTHKLVGSLQEIGAKVDVFSSGLDWSLLNSKKLADSISAASPDIIHIQYPTVGYGSSLGPQALSFMSKPSVVTVHEVSQVHMLRQLSLVSFTLSADRVIFTSEYEMSYASRWAPRLATRSTVIPIGSAIAASVVGSVKDIDDIIYFGLIRPKKGLEQVIRLAYLAKKEGLPLTVRIVGLVDSQQHQYFNKLQSTADGLPVFWDLGLSEHQVSDLLARSHIAYIPFPDGASERRSSLLALLSNGVATISTKGIFTTGAMAEAIAFADTPEEALAVVRDLNANPAKRRLLTDKAREYVGMRDWKNIAHRHLELYREVLKQKQSAVRL